MILYLEYLFTRLLKISFENLGQFEDDVVGKTFVDVGIAPKYLVELAESLLDAKVRPWNDPVGQMYLLEVIVRLYENQGFIKEHALQRLGHLISRLDASSPLLQALTRLPIRH